MRRRNIDNRDELIEIMKRCQWCHLAMVDSDGNPYVVPMNFGFKDGILFMHGARTGKKISALEKNPYVCVNFSTDHLLRYQNEEVACSWSMKYRSVLAYGKAEFIAGDEDKIIALDIIMAQYSGRKFKFNQPSVREVNVWKIPLEKIEGRAFGY